MKTRGQIALELLRDCPLETLVHHERIATRIALGDTEDELIVEMDRSGFSTRYPDSFNWILHAIKEG